MKTCNSLLVLVITIIAVSHLSLPRSSSTVEAKGKKCKIQFRSGEYVVLCPKKIPNKESQRTVTRKRGPRGRKGDRGFPGPVGPKGERGDDGPIGAQGQRGPRGEMGLNGDKGDIGPLGPQGPKGDDGEMGPTGAQGPPGIPGNCLSENPIYVQRNGVHCLPGPIGPQGRKGSIGEKGVAGPQGISGGKGEKGEEGIQGPRGSVGLPGLPGTLGKISCKTRYTAWVRQEDVYNTNTIPVLCRAAEFLQGFVLEMRRTDLRYRYHCCAFT